MNKNKKSQNKVHVPEYSRQRCVTIIN